MILQLPTPKTLPLPLPLLCDTLVANKRNLLIQPCWYNVGLPNLAHTEAIILECNSETSCKDFELSNIQVIPQSMEPPTVICMNAEAELNPDLGFDCRNGTFVPMA